MVTHFFAIVDTAVLARGADTADIAGVALAGAVFSLIYWSLGFLRMSLSGLTAQADGRQDEAGLRAHLVQGTVLGLGIGLLLLILRGPIETLATWAMGSNSEASPTALEGMGTYIRIRLLAAPFAIGTYASIGWLIGQGRIVWVMVAMISIAGLNAALDIWFVLGLGMGVDGIAIGTALAEATGFFLVGMIVLFTLHQRGGIRAHWQRARIRHNLTQVLSLNANIFIRTFCLAAVFAYFTRAGGQFGDITLAANQVLMQIVLAVGLLLDGPAIAAETLVGKALGNNQERRALFHEAVIHTRALALFLGASLTMLLFIFGAPILQAIVPAEANAAAVLAEAKAFMGWAIVSPLFLWAPFWLDGVYIGATRGRALRNSMLAAVGLFALCLYSLVPPFGNHGLWLAFGAFMLARAASLTLGWSGFRPQLTAR